MEAFWSSMVKGWLENLEVGTEEGVRIEVERVKEEERVIEEAMKERDRIEAKNVEADHMALEVRMKEDERRNREEVRAVKRREGDEKTAFWTTPGLRPLAEPPILDWDWFFRTRIPSDLRYRALFPSDAEKRAAMKDLDGERFALYHYASHAQYMRDDSEMDRKRKAFYKNLADDLCQDFSEAFEECRELWATATPLCQFEYEYLENDGRTTVLEQWISKGANIFHVTDNETKQKYQRLVPPEFVENSLTTFELLYLNPDGGADTIARLMTQGTDILAVWPQEVQDKYGHLRRYLPRSPPTVPRRSTSRQSAGFFKEDELKIYLENLRPVDRPRGGRPPAQRRWSIGWPREVGDAHGVIRRLWPYPPPPFEPGSSSSENFNSGS